MLRLSSDDFGVLRVIRLKMRSSRVADELYYQHLPANLGCGVKEFRCRLKERQPVVGKAHQSPVPKGLGQLFHVLKRHERDIIRMPPSIFPGWPQRNFRNFRAIGSNN